MLTLFALFASILVGLISNGETLKCHYTCANKEFCRDQNKTTCEGSFDDMPPYERCYTYRETSNVNGKKVVVKEHRDCTYQYICNKEFACRRHSSKNTTCEVACCEGDLCNSANNFVPLSESKTYKPSGADLSCFSCSDLPVKNDSVFFAPNSCSRPVFIKKCSPHVPRYLKTSKQDRCLTVKVQVKEKTGEIKDMFYRNCSDAVYCAYSNALWAYALNQSIGTVVSAQASCCSGNACEPGTSTALLWKPCLIHLFVVVLTTRLIWSHL